MDGRRDTMKKRDWASAAVLASCVVLAFAAWACYTSIKLPLVYWSALFLYLCWPFWLVGVVLFVGSYALGVCCTRRRAVMFWFVVLAVSVVGFLVWWMSHPGLDTCPGLLEAGFPEWLAELFPPRYACGIRPVSVGL